MEKSAWAAARFAGRDGLDARNENPERNESMDYSAGSCDVAVIGAGHAGIEAALAAARMGLDTVCFTINLDAVGNMPCNPAIGLSLIHI